MGTKLIKGIVVSFVVLAVVILVYLGGTINNIVVSGDFIYEPSLQGKAQECLKGMIGRNYWVTPDHVGKSIVSNCDSMFFSSEVKYHFPGEMQVNIELIIPKVKVHKADKSCIVIENTARKVTLPEERCALYPLPELIGAEAIENSFVQEYATNLVDLLKNVGLSYKKIELKGEQIAYWYVVTLEDGVQVYLPSGADAQAKVTLLDAAIKGLNAAKERHSIIDMRFDMVTYR